MCEFEPKYLEEMEKRLNERIDDLVKKTASSVVSPATMTLVASLKEDFIFEIKKITEKLDLIYPYVQKEIERDRAYSLVKGDIKNSTGGAKWLLYALVTWSAIYTYGQAILKFIVGIK